MYMFIDGAELRKEKVIFVWKSMSGWRQALNFPPSTHESARTRSQKRTAECRRGGIKPTHSALSSHHQHKQCFYVHSIF